MRAANAMLAVLTVGAYVARPWSCVAALQLEERPPDHPYHSVDPHGFGMMGAILVALVMMGPVLWLLLQRRPAGVAPTAPPGRVAVLMVAVATPMLLQLSYLSLPLRWCWPVVAACALWAAVVLWLCLRTAPGSRSAHGAFDRFPRTAWALVGTIGVGKVALMVMALG